MPTVTDVVLEATQHSDSDSALVAPSGCAQDGCVQMLLKLLARMCDGQNAELQVRDYPILYTLDLFAATFLK